MLAEIDIYAPQLVDFVRTHEAWAAPIVFALAFGESLAFLSLLIPAWAALVGIGVLIAASGGLNFWPIWVAASIGAALGDWLSYWVATRLGRPVGEGRERHSRRRRSSGRTMLEKSSVHTRCFGSRL